MARFVEIGCISGITITQQLGEITLWIKVYDEWIDLETINEGNVSFIASIKDRKSIQDAYDRQSKLPFEPEF